MLDKYAHTHFNISNAITRFFTQEYKNDPNH